VQAASRNRRRFFLPSGSNARSGESAPVHARGSDQSNLNARDARNASPPEPVTPFQTGVKHSLSATSPTFGSPATSGQRTALQGNLNTGASGLNRFPWLKRNRGQGQETPPPPEPVSSPDPAPVDSLGCNNNLASTDVSNPAPPTDPATSPTVGKRNRGLFRFPRPQDAVARHVVSALLNAQAGLTPALSAQTVKGIWKEYATRGYFEPTAGVQWNAQDIVTYLVSTQPL
jgi:hypothetical protein